MHTSDVMWDSIIGEIERDGKGLTHSSSGTSMMNFGHAVSPSARKVRVCMHPDTVDTTESSLRSMRLKKRVFSC